MNKLSNTIIAFAHRRPLRAVKVFYAGPARATTRPAICHWELDALSGRLVCRWSTADADADATGKGRLRYAS
jgi:hypothetical protein